MWRKSSRSNPNGECVEVDDQADWVKSSFCVTGECLEWRKSSFCAASECLEVAPGILVRDTKYALRGEVSPILSFPPSVWREFIIKTKEDHVL